MNEGSDLNNLFERKIGKAIAIYAEVQDGERVKRLKKTIDYLIENCDIDVICHKCYSITDKIESMYCIEWIYVCKDCKVYLCVKHEGVVQN